MRVDGGGLRKRFSVATVRLMNGSRRRVGIVDVARRAGVSVGTASKALNGRGQLRAETRDRVRAAAHELGFVPSAVAASLLSGRTYTVGLIMTDHHGRFSLPILHGAEDALGWGETVAFVCDTRDDPIREQHYVRSLIRRRVDGIIVAGRRTEARLPLAGPAARRCRSSTRSPARPTPADCSVVVDEVAGAVTAVEHLRADRPAAHRPRHRSARARVGAGAGRGHRTARCARPAWTSSASPGTAGGARCGAGSPPPRWPASHPEVDAVFCGSDVIARGVADGLRESGRRLPDDVALVGVDNWAPAAEGCRPPLTTVDLNLREVGRVAGTLLLRAIEHGPETGLHTVGCRLVVRASSAPA